MKYFFSTLADQAFIDPLFQKPFYSIQLLALSIVNEEGESITLLNDDFNPSQITASSLDAFLKEGEFLGQGWADESKIEKANAIQNMGGMSRHKMKKKIQEFIGTGGYLYGYQPFEAFSALNSLKVGTSGFYRYDLKQMADMISAQINDDFGVNEDSQYPIPDWDTDSGLPPTTISSAKWNRELYYFLMDFKKRNDLK